MIRGWSRTSKRSTAKFWAFGALLLVTSSATLSQEKKVDVSGSISATNNGISIVPALSLGEPAGVFNLSVGKRFRYEPELRFSLEGQPWSFLFWFRYDLVKDDKFSVRIGAHPALSFKTTEEMVNGTLEEVTRSRRFLAGELATNYVLSDKISVGTYYLGGHGIESTVPDQTHFVSVNSGLSNLINVEEFSLSLRPQIYYLKIDEKDGFYASTSITLRHEEYPFSLASTINRTIQTEISGNPHLLWNISLVYRFSF
jgi:hypothetical protein